jgi:hypothetical protein
MVNISRNSRWHETYGQAFREDKIFNTSAFLDFLSALDPFAYRKKNICTNISSMNEDNTKAKLTHIAKTTGHSHGHVRHVHDTHLHHELGSHLTVMEGLTVVLTLRISRTVRNLEAPSYAFRVLP